METAVDQPVTTQKETITKRPGFFERLRRSFTSVFRRRHNRKCSKSESQVQENQEPAPNTDKVVNLNSSLTDEPLSNENDDSIKPKEANFRSPTNAPVLVNDFQSELKQSLKLRSRKIEEGEKSPTKVIQEIENMRSLSSIIDDEKTDVKIEVETKTFEEKLALFESQISGGSGSVHDTIKRDKSGIISSEDEEVEGDESGGNTIRRSGEFDGRDNMDKERDNMDKEREKEEWNDKDQEELESRDRRQNKEENTDGGWKEDEDKYDDNKRMEGYDGCGVHMVELCNSSSEEELNDSKYTIDVMVEDEEEEEEKVSGDEDSDGDIIVENITVAGSDQEDMDNAYTTKMLERMPVINGNGSKTAAKNELDQDQDQLTLDVRGFIKELIDNASVEVDPRLAARQCYDTTPDTPDNTTADV